MIVVFLFSVPAFAAESADVNEDVREIARVEVTGSRLAEDIQDVPASAYVITSEDIKNSGARSTQEVLDRVPGVNGLRNSSSMALDKSVTVRGLTSEVLLLVDGIPFMTSSYGTGVSMGSPFDLRTIPLESIERIEVVKGASSAVYGSNAAGGVINVITKKGAEKSTASIMMEGGDQGWFRGSIRGTAVMSDDLRVTLAYIKTQENSDVKIRKRSDGNYDKATDYSGNDYVFSIEKGKWSFAGNWGDFDSQWENTYEPSLSPVYHNSQENKYRRFALNYADDVNSGHIYYNKNEKEYSFFTDPAFISNYNYEDSSAGFMFNRKQEIFGLIGVWGFDWRQESSKYNGSSDYGGWITADKPYDLTRDGFAPYLEMTVPLGDMGLDIGLRYEHWEVDEGETVNEFIPRLSLNWQSPSGQLWYLTAGRFFSMPSFYQIFMPDRNYGIPNPDLKPEKGWTYDLGVKDDNAKHPWNFGLFYMNMEDKIKYESDPVTWVGQYVNLDEYRAWGLEGEVRFNLNDDWSYTQGISWTDADEKAGGSDTWVRSDMPRWDVSGRINYAKGPWTGELNAHYYADRNIDSTIYKPDDIFLVNASVSWKQDAHRIIFACTNIFDREYVFDNQGYINPERRFIVSWEYEF
ncbi:MAG: TonB-dependent receptor [Synergistaceae bacterium]|nr:TonB-dependent receptor [Synergistaceae bacterium]